MAVVDATTQAAIEKLLADIKNGKPDEAPVSYSAGLAKIIGDAVRSATVNPGIPVSAPPPSGTGTTIGPGTLS